MKGARKDVMVKKLNSIWKGLHQPSPSSSSYITAASAETTDNGAGICMSPIRSMPTLSPARRSAQGHSAQSRIGNHVSSSPTILQTSTSDSLVSPSLRRQLRQAIHQLISKGMDNTEDPGAENGDDPETWSLAKQLVTRQTVELLQVQSFLDEHGIKISREALAQFLTEGGIAHQVPWRA